MPDLPTPPPPAVSWPDALTALPLETPPADGWRRIADTLDARPRNVRRRSRWPLWMATAAALALLAVVPLRWSRVIDVTTTKSTAASAAPVAVTTPNKDPTRPSSLLIAEPGTDAAVTPTPSPVPVKQSGKVLQIAAAPPRPRPDFANPTVPAPSPKAAVAGSSAPNETATPNPELERLYAESAQLEALLALARDERMSSGTAAALAADMDARVAGIDAVLIQPSLTQPQRIELWSDRVDALQQLAGFESMQRLLAARGERYDTVLVSIN